MLRILFTVFAFLVTNIAYASLVVRNGETLQLSVNETLNIDGNLTIEVGGTLNGAAGSQIRISGNWSNSGVFTHGDGTVYFTGSSVSQITGANTFHKLISDLAQADTQSGKELVFESNATQVITNHFQAKGDGASKLTITASSTGVAATLNLNGSTFDVSDINVKDSILTNVTGGAINPVGSVDLGNTTRWFVSVVSIEILEDSASAGGSNNANGTPVSLAQLQSIDSLTNPALLAQYQAAIASETGFSNLPTATEVQTVISNVNSTANGALTISADIQINKIANKKEVSVGDVVTYTIKLENVSSLAQKDVGLTDKLPSGFRYVDGSARYQGAAITPDKMDGDGLHFSLGNIVQGTTTYTLQYQLVVGTGVNYGTYTNTAVAVDTNGTTAYNDDVYLSAQSAASVDVVPDALFALSTVMGKVFHDRNADGIQNQDEEPVGNAVLLTSAGQQIRVDSNGQYHLPNVTPGRMVIRLNERSLPEGAVIVGHRSKVADVRPGIPLKVNFGVQLPSDRSGYISRAMSVRQLSGKPLPILNLASSGYAEWNPVAERFVAPLNIGLYSNFTAFIESWTLEIREEFTGKIVKSYHGERSSLFDPILWHGDVNDGVLDNGQRYTMQLVVEDEQQRKAITHAVPLGIEEPRTSKDDDASHLVAGQVLQSPSVVELSATNKIKTNAIRIVGKMVQVSGKDFSHISVVQDGVALFTVPHKESNNLSASDILEQGLVASDSVTEFILPRKKLVLEAIDMPQEVVKSQRMKATHLETIMPTNTLTKGEQTAVVSNADFAEYPAVLDKQEIHIGNVVSEAGANEYMLVGIADAEVGYRTISGNLETATSGADRYRQHVWKDGKVQLYFKGMVNGKNLVTLGIDTERGKDDIYKYLDTSKSYAVYGDESTISDLAAQSDGILYLLVERDESWVKWGRINPSFNRTHLATFQRSLQGGQAHYESEQSDAHGQPKTQIDLFTARVYQKGAHVEYGSPMGSLFYLKHNEVAPESVQLRLEIRDRINNNVLSTTKLEQGGDYTLAPSAGRITLNQPLMGNNSSDLLISNNQANQDGDPVYLVVDYSYLVINEWDKGVSGGAARESINDHLSVGVISVSEDQTDAVYNLKGMDATVHLGNEGKHQVDLEYAQSQSRVTPKYVSTDGGLSWAIAEDPISNSDNSQAGNAVSIKGESQFLGERVSVDYYYRNIDEGYSSGATHYQQGWEAAGQDMRIQLSPTTDLRLKHDTQKRKGNGDSQANNHVGAQTTHATTLQANKQMSDDLAVSVELRHQEATHADANNQAETNSDMDAIAAQWRYQASADTQVALKQQVTIKGQDNTHTAVDITHRVSDDLLLTGGATQGELGSTTYGSIDYRTTGKVSLQTGMTYDSNNRLVSTVGVGYTPEEGQSYRIATTDERGSTTGNKQSLALGTTQSVNENTTISADTSMTLAGKTQRNGTQTTINHQLDDERAITAGVSSYEQSSAGENSTGHDVNLGIGLNRQWAINVKAGQGYVHHLDGGMDRRYNAGMGTSYLRHDAQGNEQLRGLLRYELVKDSGQNNRYQHLFKVGLQGKHNQNTTLFTNLDWGQTRNRDSGAVEAKNNQFNFGFAYRPVMSDQLNVIAKYSWIDEQSPQGQSTSSGLQAIRGHVLATDMLYDLDSQWALGARLALRQAQETVEGMPQTNATTWLAALSTRHYFQQDRWASAEYRLLGSSLADDRKDGMVFELGRRFDNNIEFATGYNWAGYNADLANLDYNVNGVYIRFSYIME